MDVLPPLALSIRGEGEAIVDREWREAAAGRRRSGAKIDCWRRRGGGGGGWRRLIQALISTLDWWYQAKKMKIPSFQRPCSNNRILPLCCNDDDDDDDDEEEHQQQHQQQHQQRAKQQDKKQEQQEEERQQQHQPPPYPSPSPPPSPPSRPRRDPNESDDPVAMDPKLWAKLPEDCIDRVLARVPFPSMFRLRSVCKRWNSFVRSEAFFSLQSEISASSCCFLLCTQGRVSCIYNFALADWHFVPVPRIILPIDIPPVTVVSASGGLLCYANQVAECSTLFVCNPFTKLFRETPPMQRVRLIHKLSIVTDPSSKLYRIMVSGEDGDAGQMLCPHVYKLYTEVYDSGSGSWEMAACPLPEAKFGSDPGVWLDTGMFYSITELPYGVVSFDLRSRIWAEVKVDMPCLLASPSLVVYKRNRLLMIGRVRGGRAGSGAAKVAEDGLRVWELDAAAGSWTELGRAPAEMCREFFGVLKPRTPLVCSGVENLVCVTSHLSPKTLVFDVVAGIWRWLPRDPLFPKKRNFHLLGFCFEPRLDIQP